MEKIPIEVFQNNFEFYINRVENGESFFIENEDGHVVSIVPYDSDIVKIHTEHDDAC